MGRMKEMQLEEAERSAREDCVFCGVKGKPYECQRCSNTVVACEECRAFRTKLCDYCEHMTEKDD